MPPCGGKNKTRISKSEMNCLKLQLEIAFNMSQVSSNLWLFCSCFILRNEHKGRILNLLNFAPAFANKSPLPRPSLSTLHAHIPLRRRTRWWEICITLLELQLVIDCYDGNWELGSTYWWNGNRIFHGIVCSFLHAQEQDWISVTRFRGRDEEAMLIS
jgi:hypothetical protein